MQDPVRDLRTLCESHGLRLDEKAAGHFQISGHGVLVNYWPLSKKRNAHVPGSAAVSHCQPFDAVKMAMQGAQAKGMLPDGAKKTLDRNRKPEKILSQSNITNPAGVRHFYTGDVPPWDGSLFRCMAASDLFRIDAYKARCEADRLDCMANEMDNVGA